MTEAKHYGIMRRSGRYEWGSGEDEYTRSKDFYGIVNEMKKKGVPDTQIAKAIGLTVADLRATRTIAKEQIILEETNRAVALRDKGTSIQAIADELGIPAPTVRLRLKNSENIKESSLRATAEVLRKNVDEHDIVDIGKGVELQMKISKEKLKAATAVLADEGYVPYTLQVKNVGSKGNFTHQKVLTKPGTTFGEAKRMTDRIHTMGEWTETEGLTYFGIHPPLSVSASRLKVNFAEDGGAAEDGAIYVRPGVKDLDMGKNTYAQVRIMVNDSHFLKGMAVLKHDLPDGVDLLFNTNKSKFDPKVVKDGKLGALKPKTDDPDNPFGSVIKRQIVDIDPKTGKERVKSALNIVNEEGDWEDWRKSLPSQMLAKQPHSLIKSQLKETRDQVNSRLEEINSITNAVVRKKKLEDFAAQIDSDAVDLRAASMPRQKTQVIIPMPKMNKGEIYAPQFETGERVVLIRYPHGGRFEIPEVTVNNNNRTAKRILGNAPDAIGIHPEVAARLSGADFDGDSVVVIPNSKGTVKGSASNPREMEVYDHGLNNFEPTRKYGGFVQTGTDKEGRPVGNFPLMKNTGLEMGKITNLITDMSIQGAKPEHVVKAVRHSMVVIDAEKHQLNYRQSAIDNNIKQLITLYQSTVKPDGTIKTGGASTLLSQATAKDRLPERKLRPAALGGSVDPATGALRYIPSGRMLNKYDPKTKTYTDEKIPKTKEYRRLDLTDDAYDLVRDRNDPIEKMYADHANAMKDMANAARLQAYNTPMPKANPQAKAVYKDEVSDLVAQLRKAQAQKPLDRRADVIAGVIVKAKRQEDPLLRTDRDRLEKVERQAKDYARSRLGLSRPTIEITDRQWDAIQSGAVSSSRLRDILAYADPKRIEALALPRTNTVMTSAITSRAKAMLAAGATNADIAAALGIPASTLRDAAKRGEL